jgi:hypothetical protein
MIRLQTVSGAEQLRLRARPSWSDAEYNSPTPAQYYISKLKPADFYCNAASKRRETHVPMPRADHVDLNGERAAK